MNHRILRGSRPLRVVLSGLFSVAASTSLPAAFSDLESVWQFDLALTESTSGLSLTPNVLIPAYDTTTIDGKTATFLDLPALSNIQWLQMTNTVGPNGAGGGLPVPTRTNEWTVVMDIKLTSFASDAGVLQTHVSNSDDAEVHIDGGQAVNGGEGLLYEYYEFASPISALPDFDSLTPVNTGQTATFDITAGSPRADQFGYRFTGRIQIHTAGTYTFYTGSDDGSNLLIDGQGVVTDNDGLHSYQTRSGTVALSAGVHTIEVGYFESTGGNVLLVEYEGPGVTRQEIPVDVLSHGDAGTLRLGTDPMTDPGAIQIDTWHRLAITCEVSGSDLNLKTYLDGVQTNIGSTNPVLTKTYDGDYSLGNALNFFCDDNGETGTFHVNSLSYWGVPLSAAHIAVLGGTRHNGCPDTYIGNTANAGAGSLRKAVGPIVSGGIPAGGSIYFDFALAGQTLTLSSGASLKLDRDVELYAGHLADKFIVDGNFQYRAFEIDPGVEAYLTGFSITHANSATGGGGLRNEGTLFIDRCDFTNSVAGFGGGLINESSGTLYMVDSIVTGNTADGGGGMTNAGLATIERCTFHNNTANTSSGGFENVSIATLINCTITNNIALDGGGGGCAALGPLTLINTTIAGNCNVDSDDFFPEGGGGVFLDFTAEITLENSIVAGNLSFIGFDKVTGTPNSAEDNIGGFGITHTVGFNLTSGNPSLSPLGDYGGLTPTMPPLDESPAAGTGVPTVNTPLVDQRGLARPNGDLDIGAAETAFIFVPPPPPSLFDSWAAANIPPGQDMTFHGDPEPDRVANGLEYAFLLDPQLADFAQLPRAHYVPGAGGSHNLEIVFPFRENATDIIYVLEESTTLNSWTEIYRYTIETAAELVSGTGLSTNVDTVNDVITVTDLQIGTVSTFWRMAILQLPPSP